MNAMFALPGPRGVPMCRKGLHAMTGDNVIYESDGWQRCRACRRAAKTAMRHEVRARVICGYGGRCACCGESEVLFLTLDHVKGGGAIHRRSLSNDVGAVYREALRRCFPPDFRLLCWNCQYGWARGTCPHAAVAA